MRLKTNVEKSKLTSIISKARMSKTQIKQNMYFKWKKNNKQGI